MTLDASTLQKADQIAHRLFAKFAIVIDNARNVAAEVREDSKTDKWFNLETPDTDVYKEQLRLYRSISQLGASPPPLELQILLTVPELTNNQVLVQHPPDASRVRVEPTPTHILLESWTLSFAASGSSPVSTSSSSSQSNSSAGTGEVTLATVYKHTMAVFRSLYTLLRVLPTWRVCKRLRRRPGASTRNGNLGVVLRVRVRNGDASASADTRYLGFDTPLSPSTQALPTKSHAFAPVPHPMGVFTLAVTYLAAPHFELDTVEALLSSRFLSLDTESVFTPTLARNAQRESVTGSTAVSASPGSLPMRMGLPRSPPSSVPEGSVPPTITGTGAGLGLNFGAGNTSAASVADRFVLPANNYNAASGSRTSFPSTSPRARNIPLPPPGQVHRSTSAQQTLAAGGSGSAGSVGSSSRLSREEGREGVSSIASRARRESLGMGRGSDLPSAQGPLSIRRPSTTVHPFKSSTLSSASPSLYSNSPSLRHASPLAGPALPSLPSPLPAFPGRPGGPPSPTSARGLAFRSDAGPSSPVVGAGEGTGTVPGLQAFRAGSSPVLPLRPSPPTPFVPSSLGERRFPTSPVASTARMHGDAAYGVAPGVGTEPVTAPPRKRYSSSFGYRYAAAGSDNSAGSGEKGKETERIGSASYLSTNTDDDDISAFVQEIDSRRPLGGALNARPQRDRTLSEAGVGLGARTGLAEMGARVGGGPADIGEGALQAQAGRRHIRTISEGPHPSPQAQETRDVREAMAIAIERPGVGEGPAGIPEPAQGAEQAEARVVSQLAFDEQLRALNDAFRTSMGLMERRSGALGDAESSEARNVSATAVTPSRPSFPGQGGTHARAPSLGHGTGGSPLARQARSGMEPPPPMTRRVVTTSGVGAAENYSIWDNRNVRHRADSAGSAVSATGLLYGQGRGARGSAASVGRASIGSEEVMGQLEME
ncbi:hypothetical protein M0805_002633 [Coniferiporia weirii]|nr:hypothetical protein M0805_002633 [Coniferiporia weirii]